MGGLFDLRMSVLNMGVPLAPFKKLLGDAGILRSGLVTNSCTAVRLWCRSYLNLLQCRSARSLRVGIGGWHLVGGKGFVAAYGVAAQIPEALGKLYNLRKNKDHLKPRSHNRPSCTNAATAYAGV